MAENEDKTLELLLSKIKEILIKENVIQKETFERGEKYNIFKTLGLSNNETRLHSAFIAELLNPQGAHGLNDKFLSAFISMNINDEQFVLNTKGTKVYVEFYIGDKTNDTGGRIDILIKDDRGNGIIIENKIDAGDQENQLLRYSNFAKSQFESYQLLYLTKDGHTASEVSTGKKGLEYKCISYQFSIISWLKKCMELSYNHPLVRETIKQYIVNLQEILNIMSDKSQDRFIEILTDKKYVRETLKIIENTYQIETRIRKLFVEQLIEVAKKYDLECENESEIENFQNSTWIDFYNKRKSLRWSISIGIDGKSDGYYYGISHYNGEQMKKSTLKAIKQEYGHIFDNEGIPSFPLGYSYLWGEDGQSGGGVWWRWDNPKTLLDMYEGKITKYLEKNLFKPVIEDKWLEKIDEFENKLRCNK